MGALSAVAQALPNSLKFPRPSKGPYDDHTRPNVGPTYGYDSHMGHNFRVPNLNGGCQGSEGCWKVQRLCTKSDRPKMRGEFHGRPICSFPLEPRSGSSTQTPTLPHAPGGEDDVSYKRLPQSYVLRLSRRPYLFSTCSAGYIYIYIFRYSIYIVLRICNVLIYGCACMYGCFALFVYFVLFVSAAPAC
jgi:hypothetical protein